MLENYDSEYLKRILLRIVATLLGIAVAFYIGYQIWHKIATNVKYEPATPYTYTVKTSGEGYVIRSERVIQSPGEGSVIPSVNSGEKVSAGEIVANLYSSNGSDTRKSLSEIDDQIALLTASAEEGGQTNRDVSKLDAETYEIITEMRRCAEQGKYSEAVSYKMNLITKVNRRNAASGATSDTVAQIKALQAERDEITSKLGTFVEAIVSPRAGWYYPDTDGYENVFTSDKAENLTYSDFRKMISSPAAATGADAGKVIISPTWYFVCELGKDSLGAKQVGSEYTLYFPHNRDVKIQMKLVKKSVEGETGIAVFSTDKIPEGFDFARMQSYELLEAEYTGFRIPKSAVRMVGDQMGVYVLTGEVVHFRKIEVMVEYENTYIVVMNHDAPKPADTEPVVSDNENNVAQAPEWSPDWTPKWETETETADTSSSEYQWLGLNENVITGGKGLTDGSVLTVIK